MFYIPMRLSRVKALLFLLIFSVAASAQADPAIPFLLQPLVDQPSVEIPAILQTELGGFQGRRSIADRPALSLHLETLASREEIEQLGIVVHVHFDQHMTITLPPELLPILATREDVLAISLPTVFRPSLDASTRDAGVDHLRDHNGFFWSGHTGSGVIVGIIDTGIDWQHPNFWQNQQTRLLSIYDSVRGVRCSRASVQSGSCPIVDGATGHGTFMAGIAAGNGAAPDGNNQIFTLAGVAPKADLIAVKADDAGVFTSIDIMSGLDYIFDQAAILDKAAVVNISLGGHQGAHDGSDPVERHIDFLSAERGGRAVVVAAGNQLEDDIHAEVETRQGQSVLGPTLRVEAGAPAVQVVGYYAAADDLIVHVQAPGGETLMQPKTAGPCAESSGPSGFFQLCNSRDSQFGQQTADNEIVLTISGPASGRWTLGLSGMSVAGGRGEADFWISSNPQQSSFTSHIDREETVAIPGTSAAAITVGSYSTKVCWQDQFGVDHDFFRLLSVPSILADSSWFSGRGPTRNDRQKPDLSAPGAGVISARASNATQLSPESLITDHYRFGWGSSAAAAHVSGAVALLLADSPSLNAIQLRAQLTDNATLGLYSYRRDPGPDWDRDFGHGLLDFSFWSNDPWETNDHFLRARHVLSGEPIQGVISDSVDEDYFLVEGTVAGDSLEATLVALPADYDLEILDGLPLSIPGPCMTGSPIPTVLASSTLPGLNDELAQSGTQPWNTGGFMRVFSDGSFNATTSYTLRGTLTRSEISNNHATRATAQVLPEFVRFNVEGKSYFGGEVDFYRVEAVDGELIAAKFAQSSSLHHVAIQDASGVALTPTGPTASARVNSTGFYYVRVNRRLNNGGFFSPYTLELSIQ